MTSIKKKITTLITGAMLLISVSLAGFDIAVTSQYAASNAQITLNSTCEARAQALNNRMELVEQAVKNMAVLSEKDRPSIEQFTDTKLVDEYIKKFEKTALEISRNTEGAMAIYYRINPDISKSGITGFFHVKSGKTGDFEAFTITDLLEYDTEDIEHVGWYYVPVRAGEPVWMDPYYNQNVDVDMISYVIPLMKNNTVIGVIGMDIDFTDLVDIAEDIDLYESGGAHLVSLSNSIMYYRDKNGEYAQSPVPSPLYSKLLAGDRTTELVDGESAGKPYKIAYQTLSNRMKIIAYAPFSDINRQRNYMILRSLITTMVLIAAIMIFTIRMTNRIIEPLNRITEATKKFAEGDWQANIECNTNDELKVLTESILVMANNTKNYIGAINDMAYRDGLTGVKNKACYITYTDKLKEKASDSDLKFGIVMMDVNGLKSVNDNKGHEAGDKLIKNASSLICRYFSHSPVFRTGGDEFVVIMESEDYDNRKNILEDFRNYMEIHKSENEDEFSPSIASGMAVFPEDASDFSEVFRLADERMYENKIKMKGGEKPR